MTEIREDRSAVRLGRDGAATLFIGVFLSGLVSQAVVGAIHPPPAWQGARDFSAHFHTIEVLPFFYGLPLIVGAMMVAVACYRVATDGDKARSLLALLLTAVFAAMATLNCAIQTTFVPDLARHYAAEYDPVITALSMANPHSLGWTVEMWGYAVFGIATWLMAPVLKRDRGERAAAALLVVNGVVSTAGGLATVAAPGWVTTGAGLACYVAWNVVMLVMAAALVRTFQRRLTGRASSSGAADQ